MARGRAQAASRRGTRSSNRHLPPSLDGHVSDVYRSMLSEVDIPSGPFPPTEDRPLKRRRVGQRINLPVAEDEKVSPADQSGNLQDTESSRSSSAGDEDDHPARNEQTIYDDSQDSESDVDWERLLRPSVERDEVEAGAIPEDRTAPVSINLKSPPSNKQQNRTPSRRLLSTAAEKKRRLDVHKVHLCSLLAHVYIRSEWCNDSHVQAQLRPLLTKRITSFLTPKENLLQSERSIQLAKGLEEASLIWRGKFKITIGGLRKPQWSLDTTPQNITPALHDSEQLANLQDFRDAASSLSGSRDTGAQLFCALLRSAGVDARLVCSLQPLSFTSVVSTRTPEAPSKPTYYVSQSATTTALYGSATDEDTDTSIKSSVSMPQRIKRFGAHENGIDSPVDLGKPPRAATEPRRKRVVDSPFPIYWVEAFNTARQKWIAVDPLVTKSLNKPHRLEPPGSDQLNDMSYVVAFEADGSARDVTRRYVKAYNAKTRRSRVEANDNGERWLRRAMRLFKGLSKDRDAIEDGELASAEAAEPMPRNVQDFKGHPYFALERHLRRNEVIHPKREVGKLSVGKSADAVEAIYRRRDVHAVKSADKWYRLGREVKTGEQPLKLTSKRRFPGRSVSPDADVFEAETDESQALYAVFQTELFVPPPCVGGRVPRNAFHNLDVYVPSMIPPGGVHVRSSDAVSAARLLHVDYADAVVGFHFKGRKGTAVTRGVIVAKEYRQAMEETIVGLIYQRECTESAKREREASRLWKRFLVGLRIRERIMVEEPTQGERDLQHDIDGEEATEEFDAQQGGFLLDKTSAVVSQAPFQSTEYVKMEELRQEAQDTGKHFYEPTLTSPWDSAETGNSKTYSEVGGQADALFDDREDQAGGFIRSDGLGKGEQAESEIRAPADEMEGGFIRTEESPPDETMEGGFFRDSSPAMAPHESVPPLKDSRRSMSPKSEEEAEEPGTAHDEAASNTAHDSHDLIEQPDEMATVSKAQNNSVESLLDVRIGGTSENVDVQEQPTQKPMHSQASDSPLQSDAESLLSHDPDDEDAEPEWLLDEASL